MKITTMNIHATLPGQVRRDLASENFDEYDRREEMEACQRRGGEEFARRMELDLLDDSEFYEWADNGGTEELAKIFEADNDRVFLQLVIRAHAVGVLEDLTGPIMERLKEHATKYEMERLSWLVD